MLSRAKILSGQFSNSQCKSLVSLVARGTSTTSVSKAASAAASSEVTFQRPVRQEPGKVRLGFIPEEWFTFFYKKTGVTGPYVFGVTLSTYLLSKEVYVMEHEFYNGLSMLILCVVAVKKLGPSLATYLDKEIDGYEKDLSAGREESKNNLKSQIEDEKNLQWSNEGQLTLLEAKRENVQLQLEAAYRERLMSVYEQVKKRLDYQAELQNIERRVAHKHLVEWVVKRVLSSITPDQEKQTLNKCIADLAVLAKA